MLDATLLKGWGGVGHVNVPSKWHMMMMMKMKMKMMMMMFIIMMKKQVVF